MRLLSTSKDTVYRELSDLLEQGIIKRVGKGKNSAYRLA